jgi:dihydroflavonol-4-reductase
MVEQKLALVTGVTGYLGQHMAGQLLQAGWRVRGTLRDITRAEHTRDIIRQISSAASSALEFVQADLSSDAGWGQAMIGVQGVLHVASPIPLTQPKDPMDLIKPARDGTLRVLAAAKAASSVTKVVMTSSVAAIAEGHGDTSPARVFTEADWSDPNGPSINPYPQSKTIAERAAWDFMARETPNFALAVINPGLILGPVLSPDFSVSIEIVRRLLAGEVPGCPRLGWGSVDVRDVASLHLLALNSTKADNQRFIASAEFIWMEEMAEALRGALPPEQSAKVPKSKVPDFVIRLLGLFDPAVRGMTKELSRKALVDNTKATKLLGWAPRSAREATVDTAKSLIHYGIV